ncbi:hypothetical protein WMF28_28100 [Sorangium sp. So ce590]
MRSAVFLTLTAFAPIGCSPESYDLPSPDEREHFYVRFENHGDSTDCLFGDEVLWEGLVGKETPDKCEACECGPAACTLPSKVTVHASVCPGEDDVGSVEASESWDGSCAAAATPIQSDAFASVTFEPPALAPCAPVAPAPEPWRRPLADVRACKPKTPHRIPGYAFSCYPTQANGECWKGYPFRHDFSTVIDARTCTPCSCGAPTGGECTAQITLYQDERCFDALGNTLITNIESPLCSRVANAPLAAMRSAFIQDEPGSCTPSVSTIEGGKLEPGETHVACCDR